MAFCDCVTLAGGESGAAARAERLSRSPPVTNAASSAILVGREDVSLSIEFPGLVGCVGDRSLCVKLGQRCALAHASTRLRSYGCSTAPMDLPVAGRAFPKKS